jgi:ATP-dependent exoDNAse (exonuclease V) beta subunit
VEAPAGSGKTGLLIQRFLKLLGDASVTQPEQVLAITFTKKATAELQDRVLKELEAAKSESAVAESDFARETRELARGVLRRSGQLGWEILAQPQRLNIRTIDAVCAEIARTLPVLSGSGGGLAPAEDVKPLYREAARRTLLLLGSGGPILDAALRDLILHRDANLADCETLLAEMLERRDHWGMLVPLEATTLSDEYLDAVVLPRLQEALERAICAELGRLEAIFPADLLSELAELGAEFALAEPYEDGVPSRVAPCAGVGTAPSTMASHLAHWQALLHLLIAPSSGEWRKERGLIGKHLTFVYDRKHSNHWRLASLIAQMDGRADLLAAIEQVRALPGAVYPADQWAVAKSLFRVLSRALVELQLVFAAHGQCDFTEQALLARAALMADAGPEDLAAALGARLQHLLVDEMQDTSSGQYDLIQQLTASWDGHSQTVFLVGDPRQSIYLFRRAQVARFLQTLESCRLGDVPLTRLRLTANFRSQGALVGAFNETFGRIVAANEEADSLVWHANAIAATSGGGPAAAAESARLRRSQARRDAREMVEIVRMWMGRRLPEGRVEPWRIAVLVRSRTHLIEILAALNAAEPAIPFRAIDIEPLSERPEVLDLTALTRMLLHPGDRVAALAVLRAPWCGLPLADLHRLTGADTDASALSGWSVSRLLNERRDLLSSDSIARIERVLRVLSAADVQRARMTTSQLVERTWRSLGGDAALNEAAIVNTRRFFELLDALEASGEMVDTALLQSRLGELYAEPAAIPEGQPFVDLLTIHKAKGLEWDVVLVPGLERQPAVDRGRLLTWSELDPSGDKASILLAPIAARGEEVDELTRWLKRVHRAREAEERKRLVYVACTRARHELHLFAALQPSASGEFRPYPTSLLGAAWDAARFEFEPDETMGKGAVTPADGLEFAASAEASGEASEDHGTIYRLPLGYTPVRHAPRVAGASAQATDNVFDRPEGSFAARAFGTAVHVFLEMIARRISTGTAPEALLREVHGWTPRIAAVLRAHGLAPGEVERLAGDGRRALEDTLRDADGLWVVGRQTGAASELALTTWSEEFSTIRIDRTFEAGPEPRAAGESHLWIVDFKTSHPGSQPLDAFLAAQRAAYAPQLERYARFLVDFGALGLPVPRDRVRLALYYPMLPYLLWWAPEG